MYTYAQDGRWLSEVISQYIKFFGFGFPDIQFKNRSFRKNEIFNKWYHLIMAQVILAFWLVLACDLFNK